MDGLKKYIQQKEVLAIAAGLVIGFALMDLVTDFIAAFITPVLDKILGGAGALEGRILDIGGVEFNPGRFADATINFLAIAIVVLVMVRVFNKAAYESSNGKKPAASNKKSSKKSKK